MLNKGLNSKHWRVPLAVVPFAFFFRMLLPASQYYSDWVNGYWILLSASGRYPQLTLSPGDFPPLTPWYPYYGGGFYSLLNAIANNPVSKFIGLDALDVYRWSYLLFAMAFTVGLYVMARAFEIPRFFATVIAVAAVSSPYFLTNAYGRGDLPEFAAISSTGLLLGGLALLLKSSDETVKAKDRVVALLIIYFSSYVLFTAHTLSLILLLAFALIVALFALPNAFRARDKLISFLSQRSRLLLHLLLTTFLSLVAAFPFLEILLRTGTSTVRAIYSDKTPQYPQISSFKEVFTPFPHHNKISFSPDLYAQTAAPLAIILCVIVWINLDLFHGFRRIGLLVSCFAVIMATILVTSSTSIFKVLPSPIRAMQFPYRFVAYTTLSIVFLAIFVFYVLKAERRLSTFSVFFVCLVVLFMSIGSGIFQASTSQRWDSTYPPLTTSSSGKIPQTWYASPASFATVGTFEPTTARADVIAVSSLGEGAVAYSIRCHQEQSIQLPLYLVPPLGKVTGMEFLGTTSEGFAVGRVTNCLEGASRTIEFQVVGSFGKVPFGFFPWTSVMLLMLLLIGTSGKRNTQVKSP